MELDDLRRQWQQAAADTPAALDAGTVAQLLAEAGRNSIGKLWRNAWWELSFTIILLVVSGIGVFYVTSNEMRVMLGWLTVLGVISLASYHRHMLRGIKGLSEVGATMHTHIAQRIADVRQIIEASYRSASWVLFVTFGIILAFSLYRTLTEYSGQMLLLLLQSVGLVLVCAIFWLISRFTRQVAREVLQRLYGQHLDRLEATLRELSADEAE